MMTEQKNNHLKAWNIFSLKEFFDFAMYSLKEKLEDEIHASEEKLIITIKKDEEAVKVAKDAMEHKLEGMNKIRDQLNDQASQFLRTEVFDAKHDLLVSKMESLQKIVFIGLGVWLVLQGLIVTVLVFIFKK
jgi:ABC-type bacteriocin/lantibiotic exporter with double-glycine peptidase domain